MTASSDNKTNTPSKETSDNNAVKDEEYEDSDIPVPPDGGWGWVVVTASFFIHVIADGVCYSFGVLYIEFLDYFQAGKGDTAWIGSLIIGTTLSSGPVASALTNKWGCRVVTIAGAVIATVGFIISIFTPNLYFMFFSFGILSGFGFGLIYLPAIVSVGYYFEKKRAFATGLAVCGSGIGTFIFAPFTQYLVDEYGWKGTVLILSGLVANCIICGAVFRPLEPVKRKKVKQKLDKCASIEEKQTLTVPENGMVTTPNSTLSEPASPEIRISTRVARSVDNVASSNSSLHRRNQLLGGSYHQLRGSFSAAEHATNKSHLEAPGPMYRKDIFYSGSLMNIPMYKSNPKVYSASITSIPLHDDTYRVKPKTCCSCSNEMADTFKEMLDFSLLKDPIFVMFAFSNLFTSIGFYVPFIYIPDYALIRHINPRDAAFLLSIIGIANTIGRVVFGFVSDLPLIRPYRLHVYNTALFLCGIATALVPFGTSYPLMVVYCVAFGILIGTYVSLTSVILVDLLGLDKLTNSFGLTLLFQGVATFIGPPIAGWIFDGTGSYDISFIVCGILIALSGFMLYFIPMVQKCLGRTRTMTSEDVEMGKKFGSREPSPDDAIELRPVKKSDASAIPVSEL